MAAVFGVEGAKQFKITHSDGVTASGDLCGGRQERVRGIAVDRIRQSF